MRIFSRCPYFPESTNAPLILLSSSRSLRFIRRWWRTRRSSGHMLHSLKDLVSWKRARAKTPMRYLRSLPRFYFSIMMIPLTPRLVLLFRTKYINANCDANINTQLAKIAFLKFKLLPAEGGSYSRSLIKAWNFWFFFFQQEARRSPWTLSCSWS